RIVLENTGGTEVSPQAASRLHAKMPWAIASVVTLALAGVLFVHFRETARPVPQVFQYNIDAPPKTVITNFALSPDGRYVAMARIGGGNQMGVRPLDSLQAQALAGTEGATLPFWSPDSRYIGFFVESRLKKISAAGGPVDTLCDAPFSSGGTWNSEG